MLVWLASLTAVLVGGLWLLQRHLIYFPAQAVAPLSEVLPAWSEVRVTAEDGITLNGWYSPPLADQPTFVVFNGNGGNRHDRAPLGSALANEGWGVLLFDYRGYGGNDGRPSEEGLARDARAAADHVERLAPRQPVIYYGESLGAAVAIRLATEQPPAALILRSPFASLSEVAAVHYPLLPARVLLRDRYEAADRIVRLDTPVTVIAGTHDSIVPIDQSREIYDRAPGPKRWVAIEGADHNDFALLAGPELLDAIRQTVRDVMEADTAVGPDGSDDG